MLSSTHDQVTTSPERDLDRYDNSYIETFLRNYDMLIGSAAELAAGWPDMDDEERTIQRSFVMSDWGKRVLLGKLYRAGRLTPDQVARLTDLDRALLEEAASVEVAYGPSLQDLVESLLEWSTPLTEGGWLERLHSIKENRMPRGINRLISKFWAILFSCTLDYLG